MRIRLGTKMAQPVLDQMARWLPARAEQFRKLGEKATLGLELSIEPIKPRRTLPANARYWAIVGALADFVGMTKAEMHVEVLSEFHGFDLVEFRGSTHKRPRGRSHNLNREDFAALMAIAERWAAELGVHWEDDAA